MVLTFKLVACASLKVNTIYMYAMRGEPGNEATPPMVWALKSHLDLTGTGTASGLARPNLLIFLGLDRVPLEKTFSPSGGTTWLFSIVMKHLFPFLPSISRMFSLST